MKKNLFRRATAVGLSVLMAAGFTACADKGLQEARLEAGDPDDKPAEVTLMADTIMTFENGIEDVAKEYEANKGIKLSIEKPDHAKYYEKVTMSFASEEPADVIEMGSTYYPELANSGALWDMTQAWDSSELKGTGIVEESYVNALKINGKLFGFPMAAGNGTCTYVREDWLDQAKANHEVSFTEYPTNYNDFIDMLESFKNKTDGAIPLTAAGLIQAETPYDIYLREFYQDAIPDFYFNGTEYVDGFAEDAMMGPNGALARLRDAYQKGLIDAEIVTNKTSTCRDKVGQGLVGAFNYWAGMWSKKLNKSLKDKGNLVAIPAIPETQGGYTERVPTAFAMSIYCDKKAATFKHFILYSHDGGEGQMLFTHGCEGEHYNYTSQSHDPKDPNCTAEALGYKEDPSTPVEKSFYAPELTITNWHDPIPLDPLVDESLKLFRQNRRFADVPIVTEAIAENLSDLNDLKGQVIAEAVKGKYDSIDAALEAAKKEYEEVGSYYASAILDDLNSEDSLAEAKAGWAAKQAQ